MILGITGGTGCGKTTLLQVLEELGVTVIDCDQVYHRLLKTDPALLSAIGARFPGTVDGGVLERKALGELVFRDPQALADLNAITHAAIRAQVRRELAAAPGHAAIDAAALFESSLDRLCHTTVAVVAPRQDRILRLMARDQISEEYAAARIDAQPPEAWFRQNCDHILNNSKDLPQFRKDCIAFCGSIGIMEADPRRNGEHRL